MGDILDPPSISKSVPNGALILNATSAQRLGSKSFNGAPIDPQI
jgi:hypothetical protein